MNKKRHYEAPSIEVLSIGTRNSLLAGSGSGSVLKTDSDSFDEYANLNGVDNGWE